MAEQRNGGRPQRQPNDINAEFARLPVVIRTVICVRWREVSGMVAFWLRCLFQILGLSANKKAIAPNKRPPPIDPVTNARSR